MLGAMLAPGSLVGHWRIERQLGAGGMGVVYVAQHIHTDERAAIKVLLAEAARHPEMVPRFHNEARAATRIKHENIVRILDFGRTSDAPHGQWYIVMEYLDGVSLSRLIAAGAMEPRTIVKLLGQACAALQAAHDKGIVHRDVKPDNLIVVGLGVPDADEVVKLLDFGIAKLREGHGGLQTKTKALMGTPQYMAPEQLKDSKNIGPTADVYALGVIAYEMTTGVRPWGDDENMVRIHEIQTSEPWRLDPRNAPVALGVARPPISERWAHVVMRALHPDPATRWPTPRAFAVALAHAAPGTAWSPDGMDVLRACAEELTRIPDEAETAGAPLPTFTPWVTPASTPSWTTPASTPAIATAPARPAAMAPSDIRGGGVPTPALPPELIATRVPEPAPHVIAASMPTTLGSAAAQTMTPPATTRRGLWIAGGLAAATALVAAVSFAFVASEGASDDDVVPASRTVEPTPQTPPSGTVPAPMSALAIVSDPGGAAIFVDGVLKGTAPINVPVPVGTDVVVRAEVTGYAPATQTVRVGAEPTAVRLQLVPVVSRDEPTIEAGRETTARESTARDSRRRTRRRRDDTEHTPRPETPPTPSSATGAAPRYNPDDLPD